MILTDGLHAGILRLDDERRTRERSAHFAQVVRAVAVGARQRSGPGNRFLYDLERGKVTVRNDKVMAVLLSLGLMPLIVSVAALEV